MKVNKQKRDEILSDCRTLAINDHTSYLMGKEYTYTPVTLKEIQENIRRIRDNLKPYLV